MTGLVWWMFCLMPGWCAACPQIVFVYSSASWLQHSATYGAACYKCTIWVWECGVGAGRLLCSLHSRAESTLLQGGVYWSPHSLQLVMHLLRYCAFPPSLFCLYSCNAFSPIDLSSCCCNCVFYTSLLSFMHIVPI